MNKKITRFANSGASAVIMFGRRWLLAPGTWRVDHKAKTVVQVNSLRSVELSQ